MTKPERKLVVADCLGFCRGVEHALALFQSAAAASPEPLYVLYELVHNRAVSEQMRRQGAVFVSSLDQVPAGSRLLIGAHGLPLALHEQARQKGLRVIDATCQLVKKLHALAASVPPEATLLLLGKAGHPEAIGILGHSGSPNTCLIQSLEELEALPPLRQPVLLTQTTVNHNEVQAVREAFCRRFPDGRCPVSICAASRQRQEAVEKLARRTELVLVIGSSHSSNARRLCECALQAGTPAVLIENADSIPEAVQAVRRLGLSAGASTPEYLIAHTVERLLAMGFTLQKDSLPPDNHGQ
ncbi:MAG: 4-hydroxy-3-methylbut-2-enyl diphosphate reductase [Oligosphaeraceae bacterium]|nr:4-hydroxy-3-methylbut-2-enyl diphosphate reductase [Oligosphaeraceae bacterium]